MQNEHVEIRGTYLYANTYELERALAAARMQLDSDEVYDRDVDWMDCFIRQGSRLFIHARLPNDAVAVATNVVGLLARAAVEGIVVARRGEMALDYFPCGI